MRNFIFLGLISLIIYSSCSFVVIAANNLQDNQNDEYTIPIIQGPLLKVQKYTGFNKFIDALTELIIKIIFKSKTKAKNVDVALDIYSGIDLILKKAKFLEVTANDLLLAGIPVDSFYLKAGSPIYFKKDKLQKKLTAATPIDLTSEIIVNLDNVTEVLNRIPKWKKIFSKVEIPIPPFGATEVEVSDIKIYIDDNGLVNVKLMIKSLEDPSSEVLDLSFVGDLVIRDNKIIIDNIQTEIEEVFTKDSDLAKSFSSLLEDLINPVFDFNKYQKKGLKIVMIKKTFEKNKLYLNIDARLMPNDEQKQNLQ